MSKEVWVLNNNSVWTTGELIENDNEEDMLSIKVNGKILKRSKDEVKQVAHEDLTKVNDLIKLSHLHEPSILDTLVKKYNIDSIYTNTGPVLIAVNPFHNLNIYNTEHFNRYNRDDLPEESHVYLVAASALKDLKTFNRSQTILASGESGSGKTVTTKHILRFLTWSSSGADDLEKKIIYSTPLMEAFGNAKTIRNDNSSRFGKFIKISVDDDGKIKSAAIQTYLLEKIRVIGQNKGERNFHIFYQLLNSDIKDRYGLRNVGDYNILTNKDKESIELTFEDEVDDLDGLIESFRKLNFSEVDINSIFKCVALILNLGNLAVEDRSITQSDYLDNCLMMTGWTINDMTDFLCHEYIKAGSEMVKKNLSDEQSRVKLDTFIQVLYESLFNYVTDKVNSELSVDNDGREYKFIGILDIFGFEIFKRNSLEQFHINYTNECLQQIFNKTIFKTEQEEYEREEIDWSFIEYIDNIERLNIIHGKKLSIFRYLDQECMLPNGSDGGLISKYTKLSSPYISFTKLGLPKGEFTFSHYAGDVTYNIHGFCHKNMYHVNKDLTDIIDKGCDFVKDVFSNVKIDGERAMKTTISSTFTKQLNQLVKVIAKTRNHFVRCIKPNDNNRPNDINIKKVMMQLRYGGITEAVRVVRAGFPVKFTHEYFRDRYYPLTLDMNADMNCVKELLDGSEVNSDHMQIGLTKVFMKQNVYEYIEDLKRSKIKASAIKIQKMMRGYYHKMLLLRLRRSTMMLQKIYRGYVARCIVDHMRKTRASTYIQKIVRRYIERRTFLRMKRSVSSIRHMWKDYRLNNNIRLLQNHTRNIHNILMKVRKIISAEKITRWYRKRLREINDKIRQLVKEVEKEKSRIILEKKRHEEEIKKISERMNDMNKKREEEMLKIKRQTEELEKIKEQQKIELEKMKRERELEMEKMKQERMRAEEQIRRDQEDEMRALQERLREQFKEQIDELKNSEMKRHSDEMDMIKREEREMREKREQEFRSFREDIMSKLNKRDEEKAVLERQIEEERVKMDNINRELEIKEDRLKDTESELKDTTLKLQYTAEEREAQTVNFNTAMTVNNSLVTRMRQILDENDELRREQERIREAEERRRRRGFWDLLFGPK